MKTLFINSGYYSIKNVTKILMTLVIRKYMFKE